MKTITVELPQETALLLNQALRRELQDFGQGEDLAGLEPKYVEELRAAQVLAERLGAALEREGEPRGWVVV